MTPALPATPTRPAPAAGRRVRLAVDHATTVEVDGATGTDPDPHLPVQQAGTRLPVVTVRMPSYRAHRLAHLPTTGNELATLMAAEHRATPGGMDLPHALHRAAAATGITKATNCTQPPTG